MPTRDDIALLAAYNASMNEKVYAAAARLAPQELAADKGAFFGSVIGTLNHIVAGDTIWLRRFMGHPARFEALHVMPEIPAPEGLRWKFSDELPALHAHRRRLDGVITALMAEIRENDMVQALTYTNSRGQFSKHFGSLLLHFFNHQTHHRGQVSTLLSQAGIDIGVTDLLDWIPDHQS